VPDTLNQRLEAWLHYADDLRLGPYFRNRAAKQSQAAVEVESENPESLLAGRSFSSDVKTSTSSGALAPEVASPSSVLKPEASDKPIQGASMSPAKPAPAPIVVPPSASSLFEQKIENDSLDRIRQDIGPNCTRCKLHVARKNIVFGVGNPKAELIFVGEGPGRDEDEQGEPFVGRAGKLLTSMIEAMGLKRSDVYICNVVKCRPPENRLPEKDEITTCSPYLLRQLGVIAPKVICALGSCSAQTLLQTTQGISRFRGEWFDLHGAKFIATYHPAYLLRNPPAKGEVWKDLQKIMAYLGLELPKRK
jgi:uracil-DNA glycosylase